LISKLYALKTVLIFLNYKEGGGGTMGYFLKKSAFNDF